MAYYHKTSKTLFHLTLHACDTHLSQDSEKLDIKNFDRFTFV